MKLLRANQGAGAMSIKPLYFKSQDEEEVVFTHEYHEARHFDDNEIEVHQNTLVAMGFSVCVEDLNYCKYYSAFFREDIRVGEIKGHYLWVWTYDTKRYECVGKVSGITYAKGADRCMLLVDGFPTYACSYPQMYELGRHRGASGFRDDGQSVSLKVTKRYCEWLLHRGERYVVHVGPDSISYGCKADALHYHSEEEALRVAESATELVGVPDLTVECVDMDFPEKGGAL